VRSVISTQRASICSRVSAALMFAKISELYSAASRPWVTRLRQFGQTAATFSGWVRPAIRQPSYMVNLKIGLSVAPHEGGGMFACLAMPMRSTERVLRNDCAAEDTIAKDAFARSPSTARATL
jgi:hypothetical protein